VRLAALNLGISEVAQGISGSETVIYGILRFHLIHKFLTFCIMSPSCVNSVEFMFMVRIGIMRVIIPASSALSGGSRTGQAELGSRLEQAPGAYTRYGSPGLSLASGFEHPASTLPTRFPAALGIGHGSACGLANACALVYVAA